MWNWEHQQQDLSQSYRVITLDLLGSGLSAKPRIPYSPQTMLTFFHDFMDSLGLEQAVLVGNSMGAGLAIGMALTSPHRVIALILLDGFPPNIRQNTASAKYQSFLEHPPPLWVAKMGNWLAGRWLTKTVLNEVIHDLNYLTPFVIERSYQNRSKPGFLDALFSLAAHIEQWERDFAPRLSEVTHPTLILWGSEDRVFLPLVGENLHRTIPHSMFKIIPDSGHMPQWENPTPVNQAILQFLTAHLPCHRPTQTV